MKINIQLYQLTSHPFGFFYVIFIICCHFVPDDVTRTNFQFRVKEFPSTGNYSKNEILIVLFSRIFNFNQEVRINHYA